MRLPKPTLLASLCGIAALLAFAGCGKKEGSKTEPAPTVAASEKIIARESGERILIGEYGSMTGPEATFGQSTHDGVMMAIDEVNAKGGVKGKLISVVTHDDQGKSQEAGTVVTRLITDDKVVAVLGEVASSLSLAGGRVAQQYGVPMITPASTNTSVTEIGDMIFRVCFIDPYQGYVGAKFIRENLKLSKAAVLYDQNQAYSKGLKDDFIKAFGEMGGQLLGEQAYSGGDQDFSAQLTSIRELGPEVVYLPGYYTDVAGIMLQARKLGLNMPFIGGDGWDSAKLAEIAGPAINGCYYSNHYSPEQPDGAVKEFVTKYQAKYENRIPDVMAALGYDAAHILCAAMERAESLDGKDLAKAIGETKDFKGVTGNISLDEKRNAVKTAVIIEYKDGKPVYLTSVEPAK